MPMAAGARSGWKEVVGEEESNGHLERRMDVSLALEQFKRREHRPLLLGRILTPQGRRFGPVESKLWTENRVVFLDWNQPGNV